MATTVQQFLKANPGYVGRANVANKPKQAAPKSKRGSGNQSWLSSIISELGGAGGAAGGAAAGAAIGTVVPGIGNVVGGLIGAGLGGFLGGTSGRLVENQVRDNEMRVGDALKEGAVSGISSVIVPGGKAIASGVKGGATAAAKGAAKGVSDDIARGGIQKMGDSLRAAPRGIKPGYEVVSGKPLSASQASKINQAIDKSTKWSPSSVTPSKQFAKVEERLAKLKAQYAGSKEAKKIVTKDISTDISTRLQNNINANQSLRNNLGKKGASANVTYKNILDDIAKLEGKTNAEIVELAEKFNAKASSIVAKGNVGSKEVQVWEEARKAMKDFIDEKLVTKSGLNKEVTTLMSARNALAKATTKGVSAGQSQGANLGIMLRAAATPVADITGRGIQAVGKVTSPYAKIPAGSMAIRQAPANLYEAMNTPSSEPMPETMEESTGEFTDMTTNMTQSPLSGAMGGSMGGAMPQPQELYPRQNLMQDVMNDFQTTGGKNVDKYISLYKALAELGGTGGGTQELTAVQRNKMSGYQTANEVVGQLEQLWTGVKQPESQAMAGLAGLPGVKQARSTFDANTRQYMQFAQGTVAPIIKSLGETGVLTDRDVERAYGLIPNLQDSPTVARNKILNLKVLLQNAQEATMSGGGGYSDTESQLYDALLTGGM